MNNTIKITNNIKSALYNEHLEECPYLLQTKKEKILMKMYKIYQKVSAITTRGGTWKYNLATGESEFIGRKLSNEEAQEVENLKAQIKKYEVELKIADLEQDFIEEK